MLRPWASPPPPCCRGRRGRRRRRRKVGCCGSGLADGSTTDTLDPQTYTGAFMLCLGFATHSTLTELSPEGELVGDAAEGWEASKDAATWTFKLRKGVTFSDGKPMTAEDVIGSLAYHGGEDSKSGAKEILDRIARDEAGRRRRDRVQARRRQRRLCLPHGRLPPPDHAAQRRQNPTGRATSARAATSWRASSPACGPRSSATRITGRKTGRTWTRSRSSGSPTPPPVRTRSSRARWT